MGHELSAHRVGIKHTGIEINDNFSAAIERRDSQFLGDVAGAEHAVCHVVRIPASVLSQCHTHRHTHIFL